MSYRDVEGLLAERGIEVDHVTVHRWVRRHEPGTWPWPDRLDAVIATPGSHHVVLGTNTPGCSK